MQHIPYYYTATAEQLKACGGMMAAAAAAAAVSGTGAGGSSGGTGPGGGGPGAPHVPPPHPAPHHPQQPPTAGPPTGPSPGSMFTIDSILAPRPYLATTATAPQRPTPYFPYHAAALHAHAHHELLGKYKILLILCAVDLCCVIMVIWLVKANERKR